MFRLACQCSISRVTQTTLDGVEADRSDDTRPAHDAHGAGERLRILLQRAALSPEQLATRLNQLANEAGLAARIGRKTPYKWLYGTTPWRPWPGLISTILSKRIGVEVTVNDIGWRPVDSEPSRPA